MENETSSTVESDSSLMSSYEVLCVGENASWQEYVFGVLEGKKVSLHLLPHFLSSDLMRHSEENTLTQARLYLALPGFL